MGIIRIENEQCSFMIGGFNMQAIMETVFDVVYLTTVVTMGILMIKNSKGNKQYMLFGIMAVMLGVGDSFHLVPRAVALCTTGLENYTFSLGIGKFITSITMTIFYILLYHVWRNIPFAILGLLIIFLFYNSAKENKDKSFKYMWLTIVLSFGFYIPVVLWADVYPIIGMLMIPKTCAYVWTIWIGYSDMKGRVRS